MTDNSTLALLRAIAHELPEALDDDTAAKLAARMQPYFARDGVDGGSSSDRLLTVREAAKRAHVHVETVRRAIRAGRLAVAGRVGRSPRIHAVEVDRWLADASRTNGTILPPTRRSTRPPRAGEYSLRAAFKKAGSDPR